MTLPLVSCIIPVHNGEKYLGEALQSVFDQTYGSLEAIVVDDGSTDGTAELCASFGDGVSVVRNERALGPAAARNRGVDQARGAYFAFLDHDDVWEARKVALQIDRFVNRQELGFTVTRIQNFWVAELADEAVRFRDHPRSKAADASMVQTLMVERRAFDRVGPFDEALPHTSDPDWFLRARAAGVPEELIPEVLVWRRIHPDQRSRRRNTQSLDEYFALVRTVLTEKRDQEADDLE